MTTKKITHAPELLAKRRKLADARKVIDDHDHVLGNYNTLLAEVRSRFKDILGAYGNSYVEKWDATNNKRTPVKVEEHLQPTLDKINRIIG